MNLFYTITAYWPSVGGAQTQLRETTRILAQRHHVHVACLWDTNRTDWLLGTTLAAEENSRTYRDDFYEVTRIGLNQRAKLRLMPFVPTYYATRKWSITGISRVLGQHLDAVAEPVDLVHNMRIGREPLSYASLQHARKNDIPFFFTPVHHPAWVGWNYRQYIDLYRHADGVIAMTEHERTLLIQFGVRAERIFVVGTGAVLAANSDAAAFRQRHAIDGPIVLFIGQHYAYKGYAALVRAATQVWQRQPDTTFVFIGPQTPASRRFFREVHDPRIRQLGTVTLQEKTDALAACTMLCVPSLQESFGGVFLEAWQMGKPVIGGDIPAVREVIEDGHNGLLANHDPALLAEKILYLLERPALCLSYGAAGRHKAIEHYSWENLAQRTEAAYLTVLGSQKPDVVEIAKEHV